MESALEFSILNAGYQRKGVSVPGGATWAPGGAKTFLSIWQWSRHLLSTLLHLQTAQQKSPRGSFSLGA